jgi:hypothetical protein
MTKFMSGKSTLTPFWVDGFAGHEANLEPWESFGLIAAIKNRLKDSTVPLIVEATKHGVPRPDPKRTLVSRVLLCSILCASWGAAGEPTVGQQFRAIMAEIDAKCRKEKLGPYLDQNEPPRSEKRTNGSCEILKIKPADPLATEEGRFAYSIKLPPPYDKPNVKYWKGMSAEAYFKELCEKAEGDFIVRTVDGVEGIKKARPSPQITGTPLTQESGGPEVGSFVSPVNGIYAYVDAVEFVNDSTGKTQLIHYYVDSKLPTNRRPYGMGRLLSEKSKARYGYTFRNSPLENRENGIVGQELIVIDLQTSEVLGFRRRFSQLKFMDKDSVQAMLGTPCRPISFDNWDNRFIAKILKPTTQWRGDMK